MVNKNFKLVMLVIILFVTFTTILLSDDYIITLAQKSSANSICLEGNSLTTSRTEITAVSLHYLVYVLGGFTNDSRITNTVEVYNTTNNRWDTTSSPLPIPLHHTTATVHNE
jgi:hypothetical protein